MLREWNEATERELAILDALPATVAVLDAEGTIRAVNAAWHAFATDNDMVGAGHSLGGNYLAICDTAARAGVREGALVADGLRAILDGTQDEFALEYPCDSPTVARWFRLKASALGTSAGRGVVVMHIEISELRFAEHQVREGDRIVQEQDQLLTLAARLARISGWSLDLATRRLILPSNARTMHCLPLEHEMTGEVALEFFAPEHREVVTQLFRRAVSHDEPFDVEVELRPPRAGCAWLRIIGRAERDPSGAVTRVVGATQDITEWHAMQALAMRAQRMDSIGHLAGGIAHDLNNVLTPILMSIEFLRDGVQEAEQLETIDAVEQMTKRGADLVRQLLSFARGVDGQLVEVQLRHVLREVVSIVKKSFPTTIEILVQLPDHLPTVVGDPTQLHQVVLNLCLNARDSMPRGGSLRVTLSTGQVASPDRAHFPDAVLGPCVTVTVEDTGTGIAPADLPRIHEPFFTTKAIGTGTGLGLAISIAIIRSHGGTMEVFSEVGHGSRFVVHLPVSPQSLPTSGGVEGSGPRARPILPRGNGELILIVDDEGAVRRVLERLLSAFGYRVLVAEDGIAGTERFRTHHREIALVITDVVMPDVDGPTMIGLLREIVPSVRVIVTSGLTTPEAETKLAALGLRDLLLKPYTTQALLERVAQALASPA